MSQPLTLAERTAKRAEIRRWCMERAERQYLDNSRSMKCAGWSGATPPRHESDPGGCNGGAPNCLCECHDPEESR